MCCGVVAVPCRFVVDVENFPVGKLLVSVDGPSEVDVDCHDNKDGTYDVSFVATRPGKLFLISSLAIDLITNAYFCCISK